jgi:hypothetical protein
MEGFAFAFTISSAFKSYAIQPLFPNFLSAFFVFGQVFMVLDEAHHRSVAWVKNHTFNLSADEQLALSVPNDATGRPESCLMFRPPPDNASLEDILSHRFNETQPCETGWEFPEDRPQSLKNDVGLAFCPSVHLFVVCWFLCLTCAFSHWLMLCLCPCAWMVER